MTAKFPLGKLCATPGALEAAPSFEALAELVRRHGSGDWGELDDEDKAENELSVREGFRILSAYTLEGTRYWVITEADRSVTTILLPDEY